MFDPQSENPLQQQVRMLQIMVLAMVVGVLTFAAVVMAMPREPSGESLLTYIAVGMALFGIVARVVVPAALVAKVRQEIAGDDSLTVEAAIAKLASMYQVRTTMSAALIEGPALFSLVAYMLERNLLALGCTAVLLATLVTLIPTSNSARNWLEGEATRLRHDRTW